MASQTEIEARIRAALVRGLAWTVSEPNGEPLWAKVRNEAANVLAACWRAGELKGTAETDAFFVRCGPDTMTREDIDAGRLIVQVGVALLAPAEFVLIAIEQIVGRPA